MAVISPISFTAGAQEVNHLTLTSDTNWMTYTESVPHNTEYAGALNPEFLKGLKLTFTGDTNNHLTKVIISGDINGTVTGSVDGPIELVISAPLGVGTAEGPFESVLAADLAATIDGAVGNFVIGELDPTGVDASNQIDVQYSALDAIRRLPDGTAIVPLSAGAVAELLAIPTEVASAYTLKDGLGAPEDIASLIAFESLLAGLGIGDSIAAATGDVTIDVGDMDDTVDLSAFNHNATVNLGDGNDTLLMGLGNDTVQGGEGNDTFHQTLSTFNTTKTIDGGPGNDMITIDGTPGDDIFKFAMAPNHKDLIVTTTAPGVGSPVVTTTYKDFTTSSIEQIVVSGYLGDDKFQIDESNGAIPARLTFQGGDGNDAIQLFGNPTVQSETLDFGSVPTFGGIHTLVINGVTQTMVYDGFDLNSEFLEDSLPGPLVIQSNYASSTVVIGASTESTDPNNPDFASIQGVDNVYGPIKFNNKTSLVYNGGTGGDSILIDATALSQALPNLTSFIVNCGPSSDAVNVTGTPGPNLHIVVNGGAGDDVLSGDADLHGGDGNDQLTGGDGNYVIDGGGGDDILQIDGSDAVSLSFAANTLTLGINAQTDIYQLIDLENISLTTGGDNDDVLVTNLDQYSGGLAMDLGDGIDRVTYVSTTAHILLSDYPSAVFSGAPSPGSGIGRLSLDNVATTFANAEEVDLGGSGQTVDYRAPDDGNSIHVLGMGATTELRLNADAKVVLKNNPTQLNLSGLSGEDNFIIDPNAGTSLTQINITGNDFHSDDEVILNGRTTPDALNYSPGPDFGSGSVLFNAIAVSFKFIEGLSFNGQGGADAMTLTTPAGNTIVNFTPGADANSGSLNLRQELGGELLGFRYLNVNGATAALSVVNSGGLGDSLIVNGTNDDDVFTVAAVAGGSVRLGNPALPNPVQSVLINTPGVALLELHGGDGDDIFNIPGNNSYAGFPGVPGINIQGGNPSASDTLNFSGAGGAITVDLTANTVQEAAFSPVTYTGIERVNIQSALTSSLAVNGTVGDDTLNFKMNASGQGTFTAVSDGQFVATYPVFTYLVAAASVITLNTQGGNDTLGLIATTGNDVINVVQSAANTLSYTQNAFTQAFNVSNLDLVKINALAGNDLVRVSVADALIASPGNSLAFSVDGGAPSDSDRLIVNDDGPGDLTILRQGDDQRSGSATVGTLNPVFYTNIGRFDLTPVNSVTGGTGSDGNGRTVVFHSDPFEYNETRLTAATLSRVSQSATPPTIDPGAVIAPFSVPGDEDWYDFRPQATGTFAVKILFDKIGNLANGRNGLPGNGDLDLDIYDANGVLITSGTVTGGGKIATFGATNDPAFPQFNHIYVRVHGTTPNSINHYEFDNLDAVGTGNPGVGNVDVFGPQVTDVSINHIPTATYNLFGQKPGNAAQGPTPPTNSLVVHFQDPPSRAPGFLYPALDYNLTADEARGLFEVKGDATGIVVIDHVLITQNPTVLGQAPTSTIEIFFTAPLLDDRYTLIVDDSLRDPANNLLDGESNADEPNGAPKLPSGDGNAGGDFVARFTIDSRPEIGNYSAGSAFIDINGNYVIDPQGNAGDVTNRDLAFQIGTVSDALFAGKFEPAAGAGVNDNDGFDKLGAYGFDNVAKKYRFLLDFDHDGISDLRVVSAFQVNGSPVAGNFAPGHNGDEIGLFDGQNWYLDNVGDNQLHVKIPSNMRGQPIVGDFNGDGKDDLATYDAKSNTFFFDTNRDGQTDDTIVFSGPLNGTTETPVAGDLNLDGIDDLGLRVTGRQGSPTPNIAEWYFVLSDHTGQALPHNVFDKYAPSPLGNDLFAQFGDYVSLPIFGNFDPPIGAGSDGTSQTNVLNVLDVNNDGVVTAQDALIIINQLNGTAQSASADVPRYVDVDGDGALTAMDALRVINFINSPANQTSDNTLADAEGEAIDASLPLAQDASTDSVQDDLLLLLASDSATSNSKPKS